MDICFTPVRIAEWHEPESTMDHATEPSEGDEERKLAMIDWYVGEGCVFRELKELADLYAIDAELRNRRSKVSWLLFSCVLSSSLFLVSSALGLGDLIGLFSIVHPMFWFPIAAGSCGVAGSNLIYLRRLWSM